MPTMTDGWGADTIGDRFGAGPERGLALIFTLAGLRAGRDHDMDVRISRRASR
jgi:hypothetical protein